MKNNNRLLLYSLVFLLLLGLGVGTALAQDEQKEVVILQIDGPLVTPLLVEYLANGIKTPRSSMVAP